MWFLLAACDEEESPPPPAPTCTIEATIEPLALGTHGARFTVDSEAEVEAACELVDPAPLWRQLVAYASEWRYLPNAEDAPSDWADPAFDDGSWATGIAPFGYGHPAVRTPIEASVSSVFRRTFTVEDPLTVVSLRLSVARDDALRITVNGIDAARDNLPNGPLSPSTAGVLPITDDLSTMATIDLDPTLLVAGTNTLALALHQTPGEADAYLDVGLQALVDEPLVVPEIHRANPALEVFGLLADSEYRCTVSAECAEDVVLDLVTPPLGLDGPALALPPEGGTPTWGAWTLFNNARLCVGDRQNRLVIVDPEGRIRWWYEIEGLDQESSVDVEAAWLGDDRFLYGGGSQVEGRPGIVTLGHVEEHRASFPAALEVPYHHDVEWVDGEILGLVESSVADGFQYWEGFDLLQYDPETQAVTWEWHTQDAYDAGTVPAFDPQRRDPWHGNALASVDDTQGPAVYVSLLFDESIVRIDRESGELTWALGRTGDFALVDPSGAPLPDDRWFDGLHAVQASEGRIWLYDNGDRKRKSSAMELEVHPDTMTATLHWSWSEHGWYDEIWGDVDPLPNGNVLIYMPPNCSKGNVLHPGALVEVDRQTDAVPWRLDLLDRADTGYRSQRIDGCALFANSRYCPNSP